jgi:hypothetical protein
MPIPLIPEPSSRLPVELYVAARTWLLDWSRNEIRPPESPEKMAGEIIWIILCAGRSAQAARTIEAKVWRAINAGDPVVTAFGYRAKADAIERAWRERDKDFEELQRVLATNDPLQLLEWCRSIPFVGQDTMYQLAKNFGSDVPKPDRHLTRIAGVPDQPRAPVKIRFAACMALCSWLARETGDTVAAVDSLLWLACNKGVLVTDCNAGPIRLNTNPITMRSIFESAPMSEG